MVARHVRSAFRCPRPGRCTSARPKRRAYATWRGARLLTEAEYQRAAFGEPGGGERRYPWGKRDAGSRATACSTSRAGIPSRPARHPARRQRLGRPRPRRQWLGVDVHRLRALPRVRGHAVVSGVLGGLLRRRARRHEGRVAGDCRGADSSILPQLVPRSLPLRVCDLPLREGRSDAHEATTRRGADPRTVDPRASVTTFAADVRCYLSQTPRQLPSRLPLRPARIGAVRCDLPSCRGTAITRPRCACSASRRRHPRRRRPARPHRRTGRRQRRRKLATLVGTRLSSAGSLTFTSSTCHAAALDTAASALAGLRRRVRVVTHEASYEDELARLSRQSPRAGAHAGPVPRLEHRQLRSSGADAFLVSRSPVACDPAIAACSASTWSRAEPRAAPGLRRPAAGHRRLQPQPARAHQPRARRRTSTWRASALGVVERPRVASRDAPRQPAAAARPR